MSTQPARALPRRHSDAPQYLRHLVEKLRIATLRPLWWLLRHLTAQPEQATGLLAAAAHHTRARHIAADYAPYRPVLTDLATTATTVADIMHLTVLTLDADHLAIHSNASLAEVTNCHCDLGLALSDLARTTASFDYGGAVITATIDDIHRALMPLTPGFTHAIIAARR